MTLRVVAATLVILIVELGCAAQVASENPKHLAWPEERAQILHRIICRVVADELHLRGAEAEFPVTLVLGEPQQRIIADEDSGLLRIYLERWDEPTFAVGDMQLVVQRAVIRKHWHHMQAEVLRRFKQVVPVPTEAFTRSSQEFVDRYTDSEKSYH